MEDLFTVGCDVTVVEALVMTFLLERFPLDG
jgi:hypothetical protein